VERQYDHDFRIYLPFYHELKKGEWHLKVHLVCEGFQKYYYLTGNVMADG